MNFQKFFVIDEFVLSNFDFDIWNMKYSIPLLCSSRGVLYQYITDNRSNGFVVYNCHCFLFSFIITPFFLTLQFLNNISELMTCICDSGSQFILFPCFHIVVCM